MHAKEEARLASSQNAYVGIAKIQANRKERRLRWRTEALLLWEQWHTDPLFVLGVGLYWGEGAKSHRTGQLRLSNSDIHLLRIWLAWCQRFLPQVPLYNGLNIHSNCDVEAARRYWEEQLDIKIAYVWGATSKASKQRRNTLPYGTLNIRVGKGSLEWYTKMMVWLELARDVPFPAATGFQRRESAVAPGPMNVSKD